MNRLSLAAVTMMTMFSTPAFAEDAHPEPSKSSITYKSSCGPGDPALGISYFQLLPWFSQLERNVKEQPDYNEIASKFLNDRCTRDVTCVFNVSKAGDIINPRIHFTSGDAALDEKCLAMIKNLGRLSAPPNGLPFERGVQVTLAKISIKEKKYVHFSSEVNRYTEPSN